MQGHQTLEGEISLGQNFVTPPTLGSLWKIWPWALLFIFSGVQWGIFAVVPHSFHFITGVITYSCPTCNGWDKKQNSIPGKHGYF